MDIKIESCDRFTKASCSTCGAWFDLSALAVIAYRGDQPWGDVCPPCLIDGPQGIAARMRAYAEALRIYAGTLEALAGEEIQAPSFDEWRARLVEVQHALDAGRAAFEHQAAARLAARRAVAATGDQETRAQLARAVLAPLHAFVKHERATYQEAPSTLVGAITVLQNIVDDPTSELSRC